MVLTGCSVSAEGDAHVGGCRGDGFSESECETLRSMQLPSTLPAARGNHVADNEDAAWLGFKIFFDARFSSDQQQRCATCHQPERSFQDALPVSRGIEVVARNSPTALNAPYLRWQFWDGRADSLWSQPLFAFENEKEQNFTRLEVAHRIAKSYREQYENIFGALPELTDSARFPARAKPGDGVWETMSTVDRDAISRVVANVGKAIEAYERRIATRASPFDRYVAGDALALTGKQRSGLKVFLTAGCATCHSGPMFSDEQFYNLGIPAAAGGEPDRGRAEGLEILGANVFNSAGPYYDGEQPADAVAGATATTEGAFHTPSLRNVAATAPYGHNGTFPDLRSIVEFHLKGGGRSQTGTFVGQVDEKFVARDLPTEQLSDLLEFLQSLTGDYPEAPWNDWPDR
jgi:cytochrome c peroxidase